MQAPKDISYVTLRVANSSKGSLTKNVPNWIKKPCGRRSKFEWNII